MKARLIKPDLLAIKKKDEQPPDEVQIVHTIRSWVHDFQANKSKEARLDFRRINNPEG